MSHSIRRRRVEPKKKDKILIIDDDILIRETLALALVGAGFEVVTLADAVPAMIDVRREQPALIILDLYMPNVNGLDLCRSLKDDAQTKHIPVMIFTGSNETVDVISGIDAGAFQYIKKPVAGSVLITKIKAMLHHA